MTDFGNLLSESEQKTTTALMNELIGLQRLLQADIEAVNLKA